MNTVKDNEIHIVGARENNLNSVTLNIPKHKITVFTGVSGSGKSSLVFDTIAAESQRQLNETYSSYIRHRLGGFSQPDADLLENLSVSMIVDQKRIGGNARSTVGTVTDIYTFLRLLFSRIGKPFVGYSTVFSFNNPDGMCPHCQGLGTEQTVNLDRLVDRHKSLNEGAIQFPTFEPGGYRWKRYALSGLFDNDKKLADYTKEEWDILLHRTDVKITKPLPGYPPSHRYRGILVRFKEDFFSKDSQELKTHAAALAKVVQSGPCPVCHGARLNQKSLSCRLNGCNIADCSDMQINDLQTFLAGITEPKARPIIAETRERLQSLIDIGLGYLSLSRVTGTLSGGESQRIKMVKHLGSSLNDLIYIFDEPSTGLHPANVERLNVMLRQLRDKSNTILVVEHDPDVIKIADHIVDMGPGAGREGGNVVFAGSLKDFAAADSLTAKFLHQKISLKQDVRQAHDYLKITNASINNLQHVSISIPQKVLTVVAGVAGSGKSSLIHGALAAQHPAAVTIDQGAIHTSKRSTPASFAGILDPIRQLFAAANQVDAALFSFNSKGACPECKGTGVTSTDLAFMDPIVTVCEVCQGKRFTDETLGYKLHGKSIYDVLLMSVDEALVFFNAPEITGALEQMRVVGIGYLSLGQPLDTLSGGERQRIKLALHLKQPASLYILDEPTTGLHMSDVDRLIGVLNSLVDAGSTVVVIEHNLEVIAQADWLIEVGPGAGHDGGQVIFEGTPAQMQRSSTSVTGSYLTAVSSEGM
ncbi:MAG TPA: excinuclease ABC subunit UvrA [Candidatus Saccharimonadia bacterium]|nr:excinuclease ABC subunit UvrA [Candidatus Saccharimonadia bacterium]